MSVLPELERDLRAAVRRDQTQEAAGSRVRVNRFSVGVAVSALLVLAVAALALREVRREPQPAKPPPPRTITIGSVRQAIERHHLHGAMNVVCSVGGRLYALCPKHTPRTGIPPALVQYERRGFIIVGYRSNAEAREILPALASGAGSAYWLVVGPAAVKLPDVPAAARPAVRRALLREAREPVTTPSFSAIRQMAESFGIGPLSACSYGASIGRRCRAGGEPLVKRQLAREAISPADPANARTPGLSLFGYTSHAAAVAAARAMQSYAPDDDWFVVGRTLVGAGQLFLAGLLRSTLGVSLPRTQPNPGIAPALYRFFEPFRRRANPQERLPDALRGVHLPGRAQGLTVDADQARFVARLGPASTAWAIPGRRAVCLAVVASDPAQAGMTSASRCAAAADLDAIAAGLRPLAVRFTTRRPPRRTPVQRALFLVPDGTTQVSPGSAVRGNGALVNADPRTGRLQFRWRTPDGSARGATGACGIPGSSPC